MIKHLKGADIPKCIKNKIDRLAFNILINSVDGYCPDLDILYDINYQIKTFRIKNFVNNIEILMNQERWDAFYYKKIEPFIKDKWTIFYDTSYDTYEQNLDYLYVVMIKKN